ncbi:MAG: ATP-binding cassette domain-containing protein [Candidatus Pelagibacter sp. TMED118]|nr:MAG: ATP-binding cassette domain-containing protein [Candidatus Pelagibacter sp. TMED118]|tara:strand:+ start:3059 stop:4798 length:1740 start_codon:yes stop_codon:yes gene_type:complete
MTNFQIIKRLYEEYTKKFLLKILLSVFFSLLVAASTASIAWLLDPAIKKIFIDKDQTLIIIIPIAIMFAFFLKGISLYFAKIILIKAGQEITKLIQYKVMKSLITADTEIIDNKHSGKFISHLSFDVGMITKLVSTALLNLTKDSLTLIALIFVMFYQNWKLALFAIIMIPLATVAARSLGKRIGKVTVEAANMTGELTSYLLEIFKNHKVIKIFQKENYEFGRTEKFIDRLKNKVVKIESVLVRASPIMESLTGIMIGLLIYFSGKLIFNQQLDINNFFSFLAAMMLAYQPVRSLATVNMAINQGLAAAKRILPIIDTKNKITEKNDSSILNVNEGNIEFKNIVFKYKTEEKKVLDNINVFIQGGYMTSLVGHSGAGKSSIINLIPRFYDKIDGDILIDNQSIYNVRINSLRSNISLVTQDVTLFDDTIKNNISYANLDASDDEIYEVAKLSYCDEFINRLPNKFDTLIGENGIRLSGGEKQRISIARAMLKKSKIILLDEATSSLDAETETKIQEAIKLLTKNRTTLVIAHRLSTIVNSKRIYVVDKGEIKAEGSHEDLLKNSDIYKNFYNKQLRKD